MNTLAAFRASYFQQHGTHPTEQEIFSAGVRSGRALKHAEMVSETVPAQTIVAAVRKVHAVGNVRLLWTDGNGETAPTDIAKSLIREIIGGQQ